MLPVIAIIPVAAVTTILLVIITGMALAAFWFCVRRAAERSELSRVRLVIVADNTRCDSRDLQRKRYS